MWNRPGTLHSAKNSSGVRKCESGGGEEDCQYRAWSRWQDDIPMVKELADALDAELGCSRPIAEGLEWLPRSVT